MSVVCWLAGLLAAWWATSQQASQLKREFRARVRAGRLTTRKCPGWWRCGNRVATGRTYGSSTKRLPGVGLRNRPERFAASASKRSTGTTSSAFSHRGSWRQSPDAGPLLQARLRLSCRGSRASPARLPGLCRPQDRRSLTSRIETVADASWWPVATSPWNSEPFKVRATTRRSPRCADESVWVLAGSIAWFVMRRRLPPASRPAGRHRMAAARESSRV